MVSVEHDDLNIREIITNESLRVCFQPIVSVSRKMVSGIEGLIRGIDENTKKDISPLALFDAAHNEGLPLELDRLCREKVIDAYSGIYEGNHNKLLFLNMDASILDKGVGSNYLLNQVKSHNISPGNIVVEINETKVQGSAALKKFTDTYKGYGFMVALDDVGTGFSNMDRILLVKPDIIKIDISLVRNIDTDYYKQGVFKSLVNLSNKIGAIVIAEGVETKEEAIQILRLGGHMIQGYYFSIPLESYCEKNVFSNDKIELLSKSFNTFMNQQMNLEKEKNKHLNIAVNRCVRMLKNLPEDEFTSELTAFVRDNSIVECAYILDEKGVQISDTIGFFNKNEAKENLIFHAARKGTDHSVDRYYYPLMSAKLKRYVTEPYISLATGNLCITISYVFNNIENKKYVLCMDFQTSDDSLTLELRKDISLHTSAMNIEGKTISDINSIINKMSEEIIKDTLTNSYNRRYIEERLLVDAFNASNSKLPISVILADIDCFKEINDTYGHLAGDQVLKEFVNVAGGFIRKSKDWIARYGGDEFLIVLIDANENVACRVAEKIRLAVEAEEILYKDMKVKFTASFGTYTAVGEKITYEQLIGNADNCLYMAKKSGRNRIMSDRTID